MDFEVLFWILILLAPLLSRLMRARRNQQRRQTPVPPTTSSSEPRPLTPFEEALRQIQEALTERQEAGRSIPERADRESVETLVRRPSEPAVVKSPPRQAPPVARPAEFHARQPFKSKPKFYDERFDKSASYQPVGSDEHFHEPLGDDAVARPAAQTKRPKVLSKWQRVVADMELLGAPRSRRPWTEPRRR